MKHKYFIAIAPIGAEFVYSRNSMTYVPTSTRQQFVDAFNKARYKLKDGETWHIYENDWYTDGLINKQAQQRNGKITVSQFNGLRW